MAPGRRACHGSESRIAQVATSGAGGHSLFFTNLQCLVPCASCSVPPFCFRPTSGQFHQLPPNLLLAIGTNPQWLQRHLGRKALRWPPRAGTCCSGVEAYIGPATSVFWIWTRCTSWDQDRDGYRVQPLGFINPIKSLSLHSFRARSTHMVRHIFHKTGLCSVRELQEKR